jgi:uncharacterized damage-inducible protein DinB
MATRHAERLRRSFDRLQYTLALLEPGEVENARLDNGWTPKAVLAHIAFWDDVQRTRMERILQGEASGLHASAGDNDERAALDAERPLAEVQAAGEAARARLVAFAESFDPAALARDDPQGERRAALDRLLAHMVDHTRRHAADLFAYCGSLRRWGRAGLRRLLDDQHSALMDSVAGLDEATILGTYIDDRWTLRDQLVHVLAWSEYAYHVVEAWPNLPAEKVRAWIPGAGETIDDANLRLHTQRAGMTMIEIVDMLATWHRRMLRRLDALADDDLCRDGDYGWGERGDLARFLYNICLHQAEHAQAIWEKRLELTG